MCWKFASGNPYSTFTNVLIDSVFKTILLPTVFPTYVSLCSHYYILSNKVH